METRTNTTNPGPGSVLLGDESVFAGHVYRKLGSGLATFSQGDRRFRALSCAREEPLRLESRTSASRPQSASEQT